MRAAIIEVGDPRLRKPSSPVAREDRDALDQWVKDLHDTLDHIRPVQSRYCGLSGVQIGMMKRLCLIWTKEAGYQLLINPSVELTGGELQYYYEGCFSVPGCRIPVPRHNWAIINYADQRLEQRQERFEGMHARLVLHEIDHTDGVLCTDRVVTGDRILVAAEFNEVLASSPEYAGLLKSSMSRSAFDLIQTQLSQILQDSSSDQR